MSYWTFWGIKFSSELPTRSRDLPIGSWGVVFSVGGAIFVSLSGMILPVHLTVINYTIFGNDQNILSNSLRRKYTGIMEIRGEKNSFSSALGPLYGVNLYKNSVESIF